MPNCEYVRSIGRKNQTRYKVLCRNSAPEGNVFCSDCIYLIEQNNYSVEKYLKYQREILEKYGSENINLWSNLYAIIDENQRLKDKIEQMEKVICDLQLSYKNDNLNIE